MYAIVRTGGKQYRVEEGRSITVERLPAEEGATVELGDVLLIAANGDVLVGAPIVEGARVLATVEEHGRAKKIIVFKYKAKVRTRKKTGHRQHFTKLAVREILRPGEEPKLEEQVEPEAEAPVAEAPVAEAPEPKRRRPRKAELAPEIEAPVAESPVAEVEAPAAEKKAPARRRTPKAAVETPAAEVEPKKPARRSRKAEPGKAEKTPDAEAKTPRRRILRRKKEETE